MESSLVIYLGFSMIFIIFGFYDKKTSLKKYTICIKGECIDSNFGYHTNFHQFRYEIEGKEYIGLGRCAWIKKKGKMYNIRVNKDDPEDFVTTGFIYFPLVFGIVLLLIILTHIYDLYTR